MNRLCGGTCLALCLIAGSGWSVANAQQLPPPDEPRSWIPKYAPRDRVDAKVDLPFSEAEKREQAEKTAAAGAPQLTEVNSVEECIADAAAATVLNPPTTRASKASREFAEPFTQARSMITERQFDRALPLLEQAAPHAADRSQQLAVEQLRTAVFAATNDLEGLRGSLTRQLGLGGLPVEMIRSHCETIYRLGHRQDSEQ